MANEWIYFALCAMALYGISQVIGKYAIDLLTAPSMVAVNLLVSMPMYIGMLAFSIVAALPQDIDAIYYVYGLLGAFFGRAGYYTYLEALDRGPVTVVGSVTAAYPAIITVLAIVILGEDVSPLQGLGVAVIMGGMIGLSYSHGSSGTRGLSKSALALSVVTLLLWGVWGIFVKLALDVLPIPLYLGLYAFVLPPLFYAYIRHKRVEKGTLVPKRSLPLLAAIISVVIGQAGLVADTTSVSSGTAAIVFPLIASYPIVMVVLAYTFLKERLSKRDWAFVAFVILGIILVSTIS